ncbi:MAG: DUF1553 domain-containing protein [Planctomycetaceae bacterium]
MRWQPLTPLTATANLPLLTIQDDDSIFASGDTAKRDDYEITLKASDQPITAIRLEALPDDRLPAGGPGSTYYEGTLGDFYLTEIDVHADGRAFAFTGASETYSKNRFGNNPATAAKAIDGDIQTGWSVHGRQAERHVAVFVLKEPLPAGTDVRIHMSFGRHFASSLGRFRFSATSSTQAPEARPWSDHVALLLSDPDRELNSHEADVLMTEFLLQTSQLAEDAEKIRKLRMRPEATSTLVLAERPDNAIRPTHRHHRGEYLQPKEEVQPGLPEILRAGSNESPGNRLEFARWLVSDSNPLTARVTVNRQWAAIFGTGLVKTVDDFGMQGESPSHPELLDWLAVTFRETDRWSLKALHRRIVCSSTYRQSSVRNPDSLSIDPGNRLLSSSPRYRLDAEVIRDQLLVAAGVLHDEVGGPPVRPLQPDGVTEAAYGSPSWTASPGTGRYRRSLYTFTKRTAPFAMFSTFDAPSGEACVARRDRSNSPLQALTLLNDVMLLDLSRQMGAHFSMASITSGDLEFLTEMFRRVLVRPPTSAELDLLTSFQQEQHSAFTADPASAFRFLEIDANSGITSETIVSHAAWSATARALFGLDEALTRP